VTPQDDNQGGASAQPAHQLGDSPSFSGQERNSPSLGSRPKRLDKEPPESLRTILEVQLSSRPNESGERSRIGPESSKQEATPKAAKPPTLLASPRVTRSKSERLKVADAFPGGVAEFLNNPGIAAGFEAIFKGGKRACLLIAG